VIQVWHTPTQKNYMRFRMRVFLCFILRPSGVPSAIFNRVFKLFFWMRCHAGRITIVNRVKIRGHVPPQGWGGNKRWIQRPGGGEKGRRVDPPPFSVWRGVSKKNVSHRVNRRSFSRTTRQWSMVFLLKYYFSFSPKDCSNTNFYLLLRENKLFKNRLVFFYT
jgi:hypothetical protein